jgi:hypothetical protein
MFHSIILCFTHLCVYKTHDHVSLYYIVFYAPLCSQNTRSKVGEAHIWTENHQMNFHVAEYLVGALYPNEVFPRSGMTGAQHAALGRERVMRWLERRFVNARNHTRTRTCACWHASVSTFYAARCSCMYAHLLTPCVHVCAPTHAATRSLLTCTHARSLTQAPSYALFFRYRWGFAEFRSVTYSRYNFESVGVLIALAPDPAVVARAEIVMNLMLLDNAIHSFHGQPASSKGTAQSCINVHPSRLQMCRCKSALVVAPHASQTEREKDDFLHSTLRLSEPPHAP